MKLTKLGCIKKGKDYIKMSQKYGKNSTRKLPKLPSPPKLEDEIIYLDDDFNIVPKRKATQIKIITDGTVVFGKKKPNA